MNTPKIVTDEVAAIMTVAEKYMIAANSGNLDMWLETCTEDIAFLPPDYPRVDGKKAVQKWAKETFFDPFYMQLKFEFEEVHVFGSWAFASGPFTLDLTPIGEGGKIAMAGKFIDVFSNKEDGAWKFVRVIFNSDSPFGESQ